MSMSPGIRFLPTDEELISGYLLTRVMGLPLPSHVILERDLYGQNTHPCDVFGDIDESNSWYWQLEDHETKDVVTKKTIYVYTKLVKAGSNSSRIARRAGSGTWSGQTGARMIKNSNGQTIGSRKMFTFQDSTKEKSGFHWIMHEFSLDGVYKNLGRNNINNDVVLCKITRCFKGEPTTNIENNGGRLDQIPQPAANIENNGSALDQIPQPVETTENNGDRYFFPSACVNRGGVSQIPQAAAIENNGDGYFFSGACINGGCIDQIPQEAFIENNGDGYCFSSTWINGGGVDQIPQEVAIENNGDGYCFSSACINGGGIDQTLQEAAIENNGDGYFFSSACINGGGVDQIPQEAFIENNGEGYRFSSAYVNGGGVQIPGGGGLQIPESSAAIENDGDGNSYPNACINYGGSVNQIQQSEESIKNIGDGYCFLSACNHGGSMDQIPQLPASIENNVEASAFGQKRSWDEGTGVPQLEDCEGQINPKKPRISSLSSCEDDNYANFLEEQLLADSDCNNIDNLFEGLPDFESLKGLTDFETNVV